MFMRSRLVLCASLLWALPLFAATPAKTIEKFQAELTEELAKGGRLYKIPESNKEDLQRQLGRVEQALDKAGGDASNAAVQEEYAKLQVVAREAELEVVTCTSAARVGSHMRKRYCSSKREQLAAKDSAQRMMREAQKAQTFTNESQ